ncbi:MAG: hypothetical protein CM15mV3_2350 [Caudoviricetes sp.]|nr:MAG: hypothetical protein CM15mV3_2350 [Caudoviricetes sp.]
MKANAETSAAGLGETLFDDQLRGADANPAGANAYPIVSLTWILVFPEYGKNEAREKGSSLCTDTYPTGEKGDSLGLNFPLPEELRQKKHLLQWKR